MTPRGERCALCGTLLSEDPKSVRHQFADGARIGWCSKCLPSWICARIRAMASVGVT